jgi:hypothetical protein
MLLVSRREDLFGLLIEGEYPSGQRGQTVNLVTLVFAGSNPASPSFCLWAFVLGLLAGWVRLSWCLRNAGVVQW